MNDLRQAAQQALEILEAWKHKGMWGDWNGVTDALKAALAEPVQDGCDHCNSPLYAATKCRVCGRVTEPKEQAEPVAWMNTEDGFCTLDSPVEGLDVMSQWLPLYDAPPQRKPLAREEAIALWADKSDGPSNSEIVSFARAVERAHGIVP